MRDFQPKKDIKRIMYSMPVILVLFAIVVFSAINTFGFTEKIRETNKNRAVAEGRYAELADRKEQLSASISKLNDPRGVEEIIREKYGLAKEGEGVIIIVEENDKELKDTDKKNGLAGYIKNLFKWIVCYN